MGDLICVSLIFIISHKFCKAQTVQTAQTLIRGKSVVEFHKFSIEQPKQLLLLSVEIESLFQNSSKRYENLSNSVAANAGFFDYDPIGHKYIELKPEPTKDHQYGSYSITIKKLNKKQCKILSAYGPLKSLFYQVELNNNPIPKKEELQKSIPNCKSEWFFQDGKNKIKFIKLKPPLPNSAK